ncbi:hypothetical protein [Litoreibacter janthinus]
MTRALNKLSAQTAKTAKAGKYSDGGGLWLAKNDEGGVAKWAWVPIPVYR